MNRLLSFVFDDCFYDENGRIASHKPPKERVLKIIICARKTDEKAADRATEVQSRIPLSLLEDPEVHLEKRGIFTRILAAELGCTLKQTQKGDDIQVLLEGRVTGIGIEEEEEEVVLLRVADLDRFDQVVKASMENSLAQLFPLPVEVTINEVTEEMTNFPFQRPLKKEEEEWLTSFFAKCIDFQPPEIPITMRKYYWIVAPLAIGHLLAARGKKLWHCGGGGRSPILCVAG